MNCCDENSIEKNFTKIETQSDLSAGVTSKASLIDSSVISLSDSSFGHIAQIKLNSFIRLIVNIYRSFLYYSIKIYNSLINYIFRGSFFDQFKSTGCLNAANIKATSSNERVFHNYKITEVSNHLRFNQFILEGYRSNLNFKQSLLSLFYLHNESTNIYSHAFALVYFTVFMPKMLPWSVIYSSKLSMFFAFSLIFSTIAPWFGSTIYHLFMNHKNGQSIYTKLLKFDVFGIWITQTFGALLPVYISVVDFNFTFKYFYLTLYLILAIRSLYDVLIVGGRMRRRFGFSSLVMMRFISIYLRTYSTNKITNYNNLILQELYPIFGALLSAWHFPEQIYPGTFDLFLNSHNLMHLLVVLGAFHLYSQGIHDLILLSKY